MFKTLFFIWALPGFIILIYCVLFLHVSRDRSVYIYVFVFVVCVFEFFAALIRRFYGFNICFWMHYIAPCNTGFKRRFINKVCSSYYYYYKSSFLHINCLFHSNLHHKINPTCSCWSLDSWTCVFCPCSQINRTLCAHACGFMHQSLCI